MTAPAMVEAPVWMPSRYTQPIENPDYSEGDMLIRLAEAVFVFEQSDEFGLDAWQKWLIREVLQKYPADYDNPALAGRLVYQQVVISMGRQNGKTVLGAVFALYGLILMVPRAPDVISREHRRAGEEPVPQDAVLRGQRAAAGVPVQDHRPVRYHQ